jgi:hypothetical protein
MDVSKTFKNFIINLAITNRNEISRRYKRITKVLNQKYYDSDSETTHSLQVGSYGRGTAINGISDLDMIFVLPWGVYTRFNCHTGNGQSALIQEVKKTISKTYPRTTIKGDGQVVVVFFDNYVIEVLPAFKNEDGSYKYPDSNDGGSWKKTKPKEEIDEINRVNKESNGNLKELCKMARSWKNKVGAPMGGLLIDTLCYNFLEKNKDYKDKEYIYYGWYCRDFFKFLSEENKDQKFWQAPGSNQKVYKKSNFKGKAEKAYNKCLEAIEKEENKTVNDIWKEIFGRSFPSKEIVKEACESAVQYRNTEEYIEDQYNVDVRYDLAIDCRVEQAGFRPDMLSRLLLNGFGLRTNKRLNFFVKECNVPAPYSIRWKVRNVGEEAEKRNEIRGQIKIDGGANSQKEKSSFHGGHFVECYAIKNNICVARDRIDVPISTI